MSYSFDRDDDRINGYAAESILHTAIQNNNKIHTVDFNGRVLADAIESDPAGVKHLQIAEPFLLKEFAELSKFSTQKRILARQISRLGWMTPKADYEADMAYSLEILRQQRLSQENVYRSPDRA